MIADICAGCKFFYSQGGFGAHMWEKKRFCVCTLSPRTATFEVGNTGWFVEFGVIDIDKEDPPEACPWRLEHIVDKG